MLQRGEAKLLTEDWEGAVEDLKEAAQKSPQVNFMQFCFVLLSIVYHSSPEYIFFSSFGPTEGA